MTQISQRAADYIKATSAYGGYDYDNYSLNYTDKAREEFEDWLNKQDAVSGKTLYRGYCFEAGYWNDGGEYEPGYILTEDSFTQAIDLPSFTEGQLRAAGYMNEFGEGLGLYDRVKVLFEVKTRGKHFVDVSEFSRYPEETEHRCKRGTRAVIRSIKRTSFIHIVCEEV